MRILRERLSVCVFASRPFGFEGGMWDLIVLVHDCCFSFDFTQDATPRVGLDSSVKDKQAGVFNAQAT